MSVIYGLGNTNVQYMYKCCGDLAEAARDGSGTIWPATGSERGAGRGYHTGVFVSVRTQRCPEYTMCSDFRCSVTP